MNDHKRSTCSYGNSDRNMLVPPCLVDNNTALRTEEGCLFGGHTDDIRDACFSGDCDLVATAIVEGSVKVCELFIEKALKYQSEHKWTEKCCRVSCLDPLIVLPLPL